MKIIVERTVPSDMQPKQLSDLPHKSIFPKRTSHRKTKAYGARVRFKRDSGAPFTKRGSRPETPLLRWKFDEANSKDDSVEEKSSRNVKAVGSARKLGAELWRLHFPQFQSGYGQRLGLESGEGHVGSQIHNHHVDRVHSSRAKNLASPHHACGSRDGLLSKFEPSFLFSNSAMEAATKWDPIGMKQFDELKQKWSQPKHLDRQASAAPIISTLEIELEQARAKINELESERRSSKKKLDQFLQKLSEERSAWRRKEHEKIRAFIDDIQVDLKREKKKCHKLEIVNSKLVNELTDTKLSTKRYAQEYEKERKKKELIEGVCDELAKEIGEDKSEAEAFRRESIKFREEVEEERKMLQMAEVWREERVQMKLVDAKLMLEEKYSLMNGIIADLESFVNSRTPNLEEIKKGEFLRQVAASINIQDVREITYEPPNSDDISSVFEEVNFGGSNNASKIHPLSSEVNMVKKDGVLRDSYMDQSEELEDDTSEWETASHPEDQGSSYSPEGSDRSVNKNYQISNVSRKEWDIKGEEIIPVMEIGEVVSIQKRQLKKGLSVTRLWKPTNIDYMNGRLSNGAILSPDCGSAKDGINQEDFGGEWSSPDLGNSQITRCIEWPRSMQKGSLKSRLLEARMESQKIQLRQVLKHKC